MAAIDCLGHVSFALKNGVGKQVEAKNSNSFKKIFYLKFYSK